MCTSFVERKNDIIIAMNFDNNGMPFNVKKDAKQFIVIVDTGNGKYPSFGVNCNGTFINNLLVNSNGKGTYKRASKKVTHTSKLTGDILNELISSSEIGQYLSNIEVVNSPNISVHNMIVDGHGNVWIVEPGRGVIYSQTDETPYFSMTNFSLCDFNENKCLCNDGIDRYEVARKRLDIAKSLDINRAFQILDEVKQSTGEWTTAFSLVYSQKENSIYYCFDGDFKNIMKHSFESRV